jgi:hypothetical protein
LWRLLKGRGKRLRGSKHGGPGCLDTLSSPEALGAATRDDLQHSKDTSLFALLTSQGLPWSDARVIRMRLQSPSRVRTRSSSALAPERSFAWPIGLIYDLLSADGAEWQSAIADWVRNFEEIHGTLERKRSINRGRMVSTYGLQSDFSLPVLLLSVDLWLAARLRILTSIAIDQALGRSSAINESLANAISIADHPAANAGITNYDLPELYHSVLVKLYQQHYDCLHHAFLAAQRDLRDSADDCRDWYSSYYSALVPKEVRHALGSYYTPIWLVDHVIKTALASHDTTVSAHSARVIDPTAGSGAFLVAVAARSANAAANSYRHRQLKTSGLPCAPP